MSFIAMGVAAGTTLAAGGTMAAAGTAAMAGTAAASGLSAAALGTTAATAGGVAGGALGGAALGSGLGAIGSAATGGDIGEGAAMGAATGALTAGIGTYATPAATAATSTGANVAKEASKQAGLSGLKQAGVAGTSRFGVGMAAGEDVEEAGIAGLTAAGASGVMQGVGDLASSPSYNPGGGGIAYSGQTGELPGGPLTYGLDSASDFAGYTNPGYVDTSTIPDALGNVGAVDSAMPSGTMGGAYDAFAAEQASAAAPSLGSRASEGIGNVAGNLNNLDKMSDAAGEYAPELLTTGAGLMAEESRNQYKEDLGDYDQARQAKSDKYDDTVQNIRDSYAAAGVEVPTGIGGSPLWGGYYAEGGIAGLTKGEGDGTGDKIPAVIDGKQPAALSTDEFVIPADVVSHIGNGSTTAGAKTLYAMMDDIRRARTKSSKQPKDINPDKYMPA